MWLAATRREKEVCALDVGFGDERDASANVLGHLGSHRGGGGMEEERRGGGRGVDEGVVLLLQFCADVQLEKLASRMWALGASSATGDAPATAESSQPHARLASLHLCISICFHVIGQIVSGIRPSQVGSYTIRASYTCTSSRKAPEQSVISLAVPRYYH